MKKYKSIINIPVRVEMQEVQHCSTNALTVEQLATQIEEARKGKARVDSKYVEYESFGHLFDYNLDYARFLENIAHAVKHAKQRESEQPNNKKQEREWW